MCYTFGLFKSIMSVLYGAFRAWLEHVSPMVLLEPGWSKISLERCLTLVLYLSGPVILVIKILNKLV